MEGREDLFSDQHLKELIREARYEIGRRRMLDRIQPEEIVSLMLFPCLGEKEHLSDSAWTVFLRTLCAKRKPVEQSWPAFLEDVWNLAQAEISRRQLEDVLDVSDVVLRILPELKDERGASTPPDDGWREITKLRFSARKAPHIPWSVFLKWELHNTFRTYFRRLINEDTRGVPFELETDESETNEAKSPGQRFGVPPRDLAEEDTLARLTELAGWAVSDLLKSGVITAGPQADHVRELVIEFMNSNHDDGWGSLSSELTAGDADWSHYKRKFQKNLGRWRDEILRYLRNRYESEMSAIARRRE